MSETRHGTEPQPIPYTAHEVARTFTAQLEAFDFNEELRDIGLGRFQFIKRARAKTQMLSLSIALWKLALKRSFPADAENFFQHYMETSPLLNGDGKREKRMKACVLEYVALLTPKGDTDFSGVAEHMAEAFYPQAEDQASLRLKLSLHIRTFYTFIFDRLI